jgi:hypothetical protein
MASGHSIGQQKSRPWSTPTCPRNKEHPHATAAGTGITASYQQILKWFPDIAATNNHNLSGLKKSKIIIFQSWVSETQHIFCQTKIMVSQSCIPF